MLLYRLLLRLYPASFRHETTVTGVLFGVVPAMRVWRGTSTGALREGPRAAFPGRERLRGMLVVAQIAASIVLLVCAGLMMRVGPADVPTFLAAAGVTLVMTLSGSLIPALRAVRVDPFHGPS